jgi:protein SCO1/2
MKPVALIVLPIVVVLALAGAGALWRPTDVGLKSEAVTQNEAVTQDIPSDEFGGPFSLTDQFGKRRTDMDFRGKYMLIFFGYTYCPDVCPTTLAVEAEALDKLGPRASRIVPIFVTVDPKRDTPDKLKSYLSAFDVKPPSFRSNFVGLTGSDEEIAQMAKAYSVIYKAHLDGFRIDGVEYSIDHTSDVYLMGPEGKFVAYYSLGILADELAADLMSKVSPG